SLDHWAAWVEVTKPAAADPSIESALQAQGVHWYSLLTGAKDPTSLLTPDACVEAGEAALHRAGHIALRVIVHFWWLLLILALAAAGIIFVAFRYTGATGQLWSPAGSLLAAVGISGASIRAPAKNLATKEGRTLFELEEVDAIGWAI